VQIGAPGSLWASGLSRCVADLGQLPTLLTARRATAQPCLRTCACDNICESPIGRTGTKCDPCSTRMLEYSVSDSVEHWPLRVATRSYFAEALVRLSARAFLLHPHNDMVDDLAQRGSRPEIACYPFFLQCWLVLFRDYSATN